MAVAYAATGNRPWPLADLLRVAEVSIALLAEMLHVDQTTVWRRLEWGLTDTEADHWAVLCSIDAGVVWAGWYDAVADKPEQLDLLEALA